MFIFNFNYILAQYVHEVKAMFKEVQKLGILNTFTPLEVVRDQ